MRSIIHHESSDYAFYPTVRQFGTHFGMEHLTRCIRQSNAEPVPRDLALAVQGPELDTDSYENKYAQLLSAEAAIVGALFDADRHVTQVAIADSVTRLLAETDLRVLFAGLHKAFRFAGTVDVECAVDARNGARTQIDTLVELGATRLRIAIHDCDGHGGASSNLQTLESAWRTIGHCAIHGATGLSLDLYVGCTGQTHASFATTLELAIANRPSRIALPSCVRSAEEPHADTWRELAIDRLVAAGYVYLGLGQLVASEDALASARAAHRLGRTLLGYTAGPVCDVIGLGVAAVSRIGDSLSQNASTPDEWANAVRLGQLPVARGRLLDYDDIVRGHVIDELMCRGQISIGALERRFALDFPTYFADALARLAPLEQSAMVKSDPTRITATSRGRGQLRMIAACFDRYHGTNSR